MKTNNILLPFWKATRTRTNTSIMWFFAVFFSLLLGYGSLNAQSLTWAKAMSGNANDIGYSIKTDASGNVYTTGYFQGTVDFDPSAGLANLTSVGGQDIFVSKLDVNGNFIWARAMGGISNDYALSIAIDAGGNVYTTGYFEGTADFDPSASVANLTSAGSGDIFISKLDILITT